MKKIEAQMLAPSKSKLIIEYIDQILSDTLVVNGTMNFSTAKIDNEYRETLDIFVPDLSFEKHLNLEITSQQSLVLFEQLLNDLLDVFLEHETIGVTRYYSIKYGMGRNFSGIDAVNTNGSRIKINFNCSGGEFAEIIAKYNQRRNEFSSSINKQEETSPKK